MTYQREAITTLGTGWNTRPSAPRKSAKGRWTVSSSVASWNARDDRFLWVFKSRRYPAIDGEPEREVKLRIMEVLFSDEIPDPRDVMIICLADACGIFSEILSRREMYRVTQRIDQVRKLDLIGQAMAQAIHDIEVSVAASMQAHRMY